MEEYCKREGIELTEDQVDAARFLESLGKRFLVDFGYENAVEVADRAFDDEMLKFVR